jgi:CubicO group peptidase (beta-lactamase class C family)
MRMRSVGVVSLIVAIVAALVGGSAIAQSTAPASAPAGEPTLQQRLDRLCEQLDRQRESLHIPGCALAIVKDDQVILSRGFGVSDVEKNTPVMPQTLFAIGSSSKAFTAALCAMMVDEGKMTWDDPVRTHLPQFRLADADANEGITMRDLLCHNSGLTRTDLLWASGKASREEILAAIASAEPTEKFREKFQYQNVMYLAAGMAAANAAGLNGDWDAMIAQRIFKPLKMERSNTTLQAAAADPNLARGYTWNEEKKQYMHLPMRDLHGIAPAGAINSNIIDMAQWLRLQLNRGGIEGVRLISEESFDNHMWSKQISLTGTDEAGGERMDYGLGWMLHDWQGRRVVQHGGNIDGFAAQVTLLPDERIGYVLLTNVTATPLQTMSIKVVFDALLGEWSDEPQTPLDPTSVQEYLGKYRFDLMKADCTVLIKDGKLAVDVPGQMVFTMQAPNEAGQWAFDFDPRILISFQRDAAGKVMSLTFHQSGMTFECPKEGATLPIEISLDDAQKYLGKYRDDKNNLDVNVVHRNGRLAVDVPGQMIYDLHMPNADGEWIFRMNDKMAVKFQEDEAGKVTAMVSLRDGKESTLSRVGDAGPAVSAVNLEDVLALHAKACGSDRLDELGNVRLAGSVDMINQGIRDAKIAALSAAPDRFMQKTDMGKFGWITVAVNGDQGWTDSMFKGAEETAADTVSALRFQHPLVLAFDWKSVCEKVEIARLEKVDDREAAVVELTLGKDARCLAFVDRESGRVLMMEYAVPVPGVTTIKTTQTFGDWREIGSTGVQFPHRWEISDNLLGKTIVQIQAIETDVKLPPDAFVMPANK